MRKFIYIILLLFLLSCNKKHHKVSWTYQGRIYDHIVAPASFAQNEHSIIKTDSAAFSIEGVAQVQNGDSVWLIIDPGNYTMIKIGDKVYKK